MLMKEFYQTVIASEEQRTQFLREQELLVDENYHRCGSPVNEVMRRNRRNEYRQSFRCANWRCATYRSVCTGTGFFRLNDQGKRGASKPKLVKIVEIVCLWAIGMSATKVEERAGYGTAMIHAYFDRLREMCSRKCSERPQTIGTANEPAQIDEPYMSGKCKYNRRRMLRGNESAEETEPEASGRIRNGGDRVSDPWELGPYKKDDMRYYAVLDRKASTLLDIITRVLAADSVIHTDEWPAYELKQQGYEHFTVNHQKNFVDSRTGARTQSIERQWLDLKAKIMAEMHGSASQANLQRHLDEASYRYMCADKGLLFFKQVLTDLRDA